MLRRVLLLAVALAPLSGAADDLPPRPTHYVTDRAGVLGDARVRALDDKLAAFERETSGQVVVYVDRSLPENATLEEVANRAFHEWGIGQKGTSNGVLFLVFTEDRKMRIEVGRGYEGAIPDVLAGRILREQVKPRFAGGDFAGGVEAGADAILSLARGEPYKGTGKTVAEGAREGSHTVGRVIAFSMIFLVFGVFGLAVVMTIKTIRRKGWKAFFADGTRVELGGTSSSGGWSSSDSSSSSDSGGSDFSGGGGDSGGGGASDSW